jgi:DNA repair exonuclease SbcCD nuclease subunit
MVHGSTFDAVDCQTNFPIAKDAAATRGFDYLAIGDTHSYRCVPPDAVPPVVYPGAPEPTNFGEIDAGKVVVGFVTRSRRVKYEAATVAAWTWSQQTVRSVSDLRAVLLDKRLSKTVLRLILEMRVTAPEMEETTRILHELKGTSATHGKAGVLQLERKGLQLDARDIANDLRDVPDVLKATLTSLQAMEGTEQEEVARQAIYHLYRLIREARPS